jgi:hypothetical protein
LIAAQLIVRPEEVTLHDPVARYLGMGKLWAVLGKTSSGMRTPLALNRMPSIGGQLFKGEEQESKNGLPSSILMSHAPVGSWTLSRPLKVIPFLSEERWRGDSKCQKQREQPKQTFTATAVIEN